MKCSNCGQVVKEGAAFCPACGTKLQKKFCPHCGAEMREEAAFCPMCGQSAEQHDIMHPSLPPQLEQPTAKANGVRLAVIVCVALVLIVAVVSATFLKVSSQKREAALAQQNTTPVTQSETSQITEETVETDKTEQEVSEEIPDTAVTNERHTALREQYQSRIDGLWMEMEVIDSNARNQADLNQLSYENYQHWDSLLNEIYQQIKSELSSSEFASLKESETAWIAQRDHTADRDAADWTGGTGYAAVYNGSMAKSTGERCQWLVDQYLK